MRVMLLSLVPAIFLAPNDGYAEQALFVVDVERILQISVDAVYEAYPELPADDLMLEQTLSAACISLRLFARQGAPYPDPPPCFTDMDFVLMSTLHEGRHLDENGECTSGTIGERVTVQLNRDGSVNRLSRHGWVEAGDYVLRECP